MDAGKGHARDPKQIVRDGYDVASLAYRGDGEGDGSYGDWLDELAPLLPDGGEILDLGCGNGIPVARWLTGRGYAVEGVDISAVQIERARSLVPNASFLCEDMTSVTFPPGSFDAVLAFYSLIHVPIEEQPELLERIRGWLRPGGLLMAIVGDGAWTSTQDDWYGATMYWSHADRETSIEWMASAGLDVLWNRFIAEGDGGHTLILARSSVPSLA